MILQGRQVPNEGCDEFMFEGQHTLQLILIIGVVLCIPVMLLGKPLYVVFTRRNKGDQPVAVNVSFGSELFIFQ